MTKSSSAQPSQQQPKPGSELRRLDVFVGKWNMEGQQYDSLIGAAAKITAVETYEWLAGGFFLVHHFAGHVGESEAGCIEITGHDASSQTYPTHSFYNDGVSNEWQIRERDGIWTRTGDWQMPGKSLKVRFTAGFRDSGKTIEGKWEYSSDDSKWQTFWDVQSTKVK